MISQQVTAEAHCLFMASSLEPRQGKLYSPCVLFAFLSWHSHSLSLSSLLISLSPQSRPPTKTVSRRGHGLWEVMEVVCIERLWAPHFHWNYIWKKVDYTPRGLEINKYIIEPSGCLFSSVFPLKMKESHHNTASAGAGYWTLCSVYL